MIKAVTLGLRYATAASLISLFTGRVLGSLCLKVNNSNDNNGLKGVDRPWHSTGLFTEQESDSFTVME